MNLSRPLRLSLIVLIVAGVMTIVWNFLSRRQEAIVVPDGEILSPEVTRRSTKFQYAEHKRERTVFTVYAETSIETVNGVHSLKDVNVAYYDETGEPSDVISSRQAVYRIEEKQVEFSGDTKIQLADGTQVFSDEVTADLDQEIVKINHHFRFQRGEIKGEGRSLIYPVLQQQIRISNGLQLTIPSGLQVVKAETQQAVYHISEQVIELIGNAAVSGPDTRLTADEMTICLTEEHGIEKILSVGHAELRSGSLQSFSGQSINVFFEPSFKRVKYFEVLRSWQEGNSDSDKAIYKERVRGGISVLEADRITAVPHQKRDEDQLFLGKFNAQGNVLFFSPAMGIKEAHSDELEGAFFEDGEHLQELELRGRVCVKRERRGDKPPLEEDLHCEVLHLRLGASEVLEYAKAEGNVNLSVNSQQGHRHVSAREFVEVDYKDGVPKRVVSQGNCRIESAFPGVRNVLEARLIEISYYQGLLECIWAEGGVLLESFERGKTTYTTSEQLKVWYESGEIEKAVQSGNFHLWEGDPKTIDLESDQAVFDPKTQRVTMTGQKPPVLRFRGENGAGTSLVETVTQRFELDKKTGQLFAFGQVRSLVPGKDSSIIITSGRMQSNPETGWVRYFVNPRINQQSNSIVGKMVRYNHQDQQLVVEEGVESVLLQGTETNRKRYRVEANYLVYKRIDLRARYEGDVRVKAEDLIVKAPLVEFIFEPSDPDQFQQIVAWGGVQITGNNREATGNQAVHYPFEDKVVLTGDPAQVFEFERGKVTGRRLTFYIGDERLLVENPPAAEKP